MSGEGPVPSNGDWWFMIVTTGLLLAWILWSLLTGDLTPWD